MNQDLIWRQPQYGVGCPNDSCATYGMPAGTWFMPMRGQCGHDDHNPYAAAVAKEVKPGTTNFRHDNKNLIQETDESG